jgi:hypothetical protein
MKTAMLKIHSKGFNGLDAADYYCMTNRKDQRT